MPLKKRSISNVKNARKSAARREANRIRKLALKARLKEIKSAGSREEAVKLIARVQSVIDKAARQGIIHRNKAARLKSQVAKIPAQLS